MVRAAAGEDVPVPRRPGSMTVVTIEPEWSLPERLLGFVHKPDPIHIGYGGGTWRYSHGERATRLMLNAPVWHPAFARQTLMPSDSVSLDQGATFTFEFIEVDPSFTSTPTGTNEDIRDLVISASRNPPSVAGELEVIRSGGLAVSPRADLCVDIAVNGPQPLVVVSIPGGSALRVEPGSDGNVAVYLEVDDAFTQEESRGFSVTPDPFEISLPTAFDGELSVVRVHPPATATTTLCLVSLS
jgi:hypothetical protein